MKRHHKQHKLTQPPDPHLLLAFAGHDLRLLILLSVSTISSYHHAPSITTEMAFILPATWRSTPHPRLSSPSLTCPPAQKPRLAKRAFWRCQSSTEVNTSTEDVFAIDAGRDLFFAGMDAGMAIAILDAPLDKEYEKGIEDLFIAAERLKFFPSEESTSALIRYICKFDLSKMDSYRFEMRVARRKCVESLGRHKGKFQKEKVKALLKDCMQEDDPNLVEVCVWALAEIGVSNDEDVLSSIVDILDKDNVQKRVVIQTLLRAGYKPALERIRPFIDSPFPAVASAALSAVATFDNDVEAMKPVVQILKSDVLNERRAAIEDLTLARYVPALEDVAVCPNSLVLRCRTVRVFLDVRKQDEPQLADTLDDYTAKLVDRLIWDHPGDVDLLGMKKETKKSRDAARNIRQLYKNDALYSYLACRTLAEDYRDSDDETTHAAVLKSYTDLPYFDYFGAYHAYKTLGWLKYQGAYDLLLENARTLPPRFFNHKAGAITALAELGNADVVDSIVDIAKDATLWELKYACLITAERLGDGRVRELFKSDSDWLVRARCNTNLDFTHLHNTFPKHK